MGCGAVNSVSQPNSIKNNQTPVQNRSYSKINNRNNNSSNKKYQQQQKQNGKQYQFFKQQMNKLVQNNQTMDKKYLIKQLIGKGSFGSVYRCIKLDTKQEFALKIVKLNAKTKQQAEKQIRNLKSQISVLKKLNHPNIIKYYSFDVSEDSETVEIVFQLISQGSLKDYIKRRGPLTQLQASNICKYILHGLQYLHEKSIIHRDLKCANILITKQGIPKITDFGTAKEVKIKTNQDIARLCASLKGTPYYMAPQILKRSGHHKSADIWSFGCTLIQMLTGKAPWTTLTNNFQQIISYIVSGILPPLPQNITKQCQFFLLSCLDQIPSQRLTAKQLLNHRFIELNKRKTPSLIYDQQSPQKQKKFEKSIKKEEVHFLDLNSTQISKKNKNFKYNNPKQFTQRQDYVKTNQVKVQRNENKTGNENSQPFLNYYGKNNEQLPSSNGNINMRKKIKSAKKQTQGLKRTSKTVQYMKMTQQNILNWKQIQENQLNEYNNKGYKTKIGQSAPQMKINKDKRLANNLKTNSQISQVNEQQQYYQQKQIINTSIANQQRNRYIQAQKKQRQRKQIQKNKWQQQLKKQSQLRKNQLSKKMLKLGEQNILIKG